MIVTTIAHDGNVHAAANCVHNFLGDKAAVGIYYDDDSIGYVKITRVNADGGEYVTLMPPSHRLVTTDGGATFRIEEVVINPAHEIKRLQDAVDSWRARWLEESKETDRMGQRSDRLESEVRDLTAELAEAKARLQAVSLLRVWKDNLGRGFVFADELGHAIDPERFPEPKPIRLGAKEAAA